MIHIGDKASNYFAFVSLTLRQPTGTTIRGGVGGVSSKGIVLQGFHGPAINPELSFINP